MNTNNKALDYFVKLMKEKKLVYHNGELWKLWEPRVNWLPSPKRAEKLTTNGYYVLRSYRVKSVMAHRVIWSYFNGKIPKNKVINHIDFNKTNNKITNLELVSSRRNLYYTITNGRFNPPKEKRNHRYKLSNQDVKDIKKLLATGKYLQKDIAQKYNVRPNLISRIKTGARRNK